MEQKIVLQCVGKKCAATGILLCLFIIYVCIYILLLYTLCTLQILELNIIISHAIYNFEVLVKQCNAQASLIWKNVYKHRTSKYQTFLRTVEESTSLKDDLLDERTALPYVCLWQWRWETPFVSQCTSSRPVFFSVSVRYYSDKCYWEMKYFWWAL